ncbi:uncharacterized protein LOC110449693 isoform X2 [Mizuhopecten yessoensis]|uniref:uncharacterized protein LOC110449693 isoform X2 n=1 Tax=Mizuhopecten yessoensis TaxID=6573 RepID=UPI000B459A42|nr:uncharacterized protein LOC110449693 isoform X2 [Mizuhopecten yessoensis]
MLSGVCSILSRHQVYNTGSNLGLSGLLTYIQGPLDEQRGALQCHICLQCPKGQYSDQHTRDWRDLRYCRLDRNCTKKNRLYKRKPKQSRKSECGPCLDGYVQESNWDDDDGVCNKIQKTTSSPEVKVTSSPDVKVTTSPDVKVTNSPGGIKPTSSVDTNASNPEDYIAQTESTKHKSVQGTVPRQNIGHLEKTVKEEGKRSRDHHEQYAVITIVLYVVGILMIIGLLIFFGYKLRKKTVCFNSSTNNERSESPLGNSKTPLMVDGASSQQSSPQQSVIHIGVPQVTTEQTGFRETLGSDVVLFSLVTGACVQSVVWKRIQGGLITVLAVDNQKYGGSTITDPSLHIYHVCFEDEGVYQCTATNDVGTGASSLCHLKVTKNPDLVFTGKEIARAKGIQLQPYNDGMLHCVANYATGDKSENHIMEKLYDQLEIPPHRVKQIREDFISKGVRECVLETLSCYVKKKDKKATVYALYEALTVCQYFYELQFYVKVFRDQLSEEDMDIPVNDNGTDDCADDEQQGSSDISVEDLQGTDDTYVSDEQETVQISMGSPQVTVEDEVKLGVEDVRFTVLDH